MGEPRGALPDMRIPATGVLADLVPASQPNGNTAIYEGTDAVDRLYDEFDRHYPRNEGDTQ